MKRIFIAAAALVALSSVSAVAEDQAEAPKKEKKICHTEKVTGSLTRVTRTCLTEAEWREVQNNTKKGVDEMQGDASGGMAIKNMPGPGG